MKFEEILKVLDVLTWVEVVKTGDGVVYKGRLRDIKPSDMVDYRVYQVLPCGSSKETYLEIRVY